MDAEPQRKDPKPQLSCGVAEMRGIEVALQTSSSCARRRERSPGLSVVPVRPGGDNLTLSCVTRQPQPRRSGSRRLHAMMHCLSQAARGKHAFCANAMIAFTSAYMYLDFDQDSLRLADKLTLPCGTLSLRLVRSTLQGCKDLRTSSLKPSFRLPHVKRQG